MFDRFKRSLITFLRTILRLKMTSDWDDPSQAVLPPVTENVLTYRMRMASIKKADGLALLQKWRVTCLRGYKSRATSRHEYVSATVVDSKNRTSYIIIERQRGDPIELQVRPSESVNECNTDRNIDSARLKPFSASNPSLLSISISLNSDSLATCDSISPIPSPGTKKDNDDLIYELNFKETPLYLYQLALLAFLVHKENTQYLLMDNNCYHYAGTIMKVLESAYRVTNTVDPTIAGKWWCGLVIFPLTKGGNLVSFVEKFREEIRAFVSFSNFQFLSFTYASLVYRNLCQKRGMRIWRWRMRSLENS
jgi:hypothetical protein